MIVLLPYVIKTTTLLLLYIFNKTVFKTCLVYRYINCEEKEMFDNIYYQDVKYKEYQGKSASVTDIWARETTIKALRTKGNIHVTHGSDGDTTSCTIQYKTKEKLIPKSLINGREIMECVKVPAFGLDCGYISYVK